MHWQGGDAGQLVNAVHAVVVEEHGVVAVDMPATKEKHLPSLVDDLPIREIGALWFVGWGQARFAVERQSQIGLAGKIQQVRHQPGIAPGGEQQVGVMPVDYGAQPDQQGADGF